MKAKGSLLVIICALTLSSISAQESIMPMCNTTWTQGKPFNGECPILDGNRAPTGCGPIAVSQIFFYYQNRVRGYGRATYKLNDSLTVDVDLEHNPIDWNHVLPHYKYGEYSPTDSAAVASLVAQVGAAMHARYGKKNTSINLYGPMLWGLHHFFHISPEARYLNRKFYSSAQWVEMVNNELENNHPVFYRGDHTSQYKEEDAGHMFIIDGRDQDGNYHFNFGINHAQDKYTDLNVINQGTGYWAGVGNVSYHHIQAMVTNLFPADGMGDDAYPQHSAILVHPIVLDWDTTAITKTARTKIVTQYQVRSYTFTGQSFEAGVGFFQNGKLIATSSTIQQITELPGREGVAHNFSKTLSLPDLPNGDYEMCAITRIDPNDEWVRVMDNAINSISVIVDDGTFTFHLPDNHNGRARLCQRNGFRKQEGTYKRSSGTFVEFDVCNISTNNFEDTLKLELNVNGTVTEYNMSASVYDGQKITCRFFVENYKLDSGLQHSLQAYYHDKKDNTYHALTDYETSAPNVQAATPKLIAVYTTAGVLLKQFKADEMSDYSSFLNCLPKGVYVIKDKDNTRKFAKRTSRR